MGGPCLTTHTRSSITSVEEDDNEDATDDDRGWTICEDDKWIQVDEGVHDDEVHADDDVGVTDDGVHDDDGGGWGADGHIDTSNNDWHGDGHSVPTVEDDDHHEEPSASSSTSGSYSKSGDGGSKSGKSGGYSSRGASAEVDDDKCVRRGVLHQSRCLGHGDRQTRPRDDPVRVQWRRRGGCRPRRVHGG